MGTTFSCRLVGDRVSKLKNPSSHQDIEHVRAKQASKVEVMSPITFRVENGTFVGCMVGVI